MKKFFKVLTLTLVVATIAAISAMSLVGCGSKVTPVAKAMEGAEEESYAFCVKEGNTELKDQLNAFFAKDTTKTAVNTSMAYHTGGSDKSIAYPDLSDNTGKTITMITEAGFAPYEFSKTSGDGVVNSVAGVDVDLMMLFCEENNYKLELKNIEFKAIPDEVNKSNDYVGAAGMSVTAEREEVVDFATPYVQTIQYIISSEDNAFANIDQLKGKTIAVQTGTTGDIIIDDEIKNGALKDSGAEKKSYDKVMIAFDALLNGKIDAVVIDQFVAIGLVENI